MANYYPPVGFHFRVDFSEVSSQAEDACFQSVSGLSVDLETETIKEGGENRFVHHLPKQSKYSNLSLKRGMFCDSELIHWCLNAFENFQFKPANLTVSLLNDQHEPLKTWVIVHAFPIKWSVSDFNAEQNTIVIESLELKYHYFKLI